MLYVLNLASLLVMPVPFGSGSILAMIWELPMAPAMVGINGVSGEGTMFSYALFALLAAVEPLCFYTGAHPQREKACQIRRQRKFSRIFRRCGSGHNK